MKKMEDLNIIVLAAGKGVRMNSNISKVLHKVCGRSLVEITLRAASKLNPSKVIVVVGNNKDDVISHVNEFKSTFLKDVNLEFSFQKEQNGTGDAVKVGLKKIEKGAKKILILPSDSPLIDESVLNSLIEGEDKKVKFLISTPKNPFGLGRVIRDKSLNILKIVEHKDCSEEEKKINEVNTSIYLVDREFLEDSIKKLNTKNAQGEYYLTDIVFDASREDIHSVKGIKIRDSLLVQGANSRLELIELEKEKRLRLVKKAINGGVRVEDINTLYLEEGVSIGKDSFIGANTHLKGETQIGENVVIEGNSFIENSILEDNVLIRFNSVLENSYVSSNSSIGPFSRLRPEAKLDKNVKVGNFCEIKKSHVREGAKINHLSYIGDSEVGKRVNVGAGTITCNYDGVNKHKTVLEDDTFIGSNSCFISPVTIKKGAYIGAGSVITKDVSENSLGISRVKQGEVFNWALKKASKDNKK